MVVCCLLYSVEPKSRHHVADRVILRGSSELDRTRFAGPTRSRRYLCAGRWADRTDHRHFVGALHTGGSSRASSCAPRALRHFASAVPRRCASARLALWWGVPGGSREPVSIGINCSRKFAVVATFVVPLPSPLLAYRSTLALTEACSSVSRAASAASVIRTSRFERCARPRPARGRRTWSRPSSGWRWPRPPLSRSNSVFAESNWAPSSRPWVSDPDLIYSLNPANPESPGSFRGKAPGPRAAGRLRVICLGGSAVTR